MRQGLEHSPLPPMEHRGLYFFPTQVPVIKMPVRVLHIGYRPIGYLTRKFKAIDVVVGKESQGINSLGSTLDVHRIGAVMEIFGTTVNLEKMFFEIRIAKLKLPGKIGIACAVLVAF